MGDGSIDIAAMLRRVVVDVFGESAGVEYAQPDGAPHVVRARVTRFDDTATDLGLEASHEWFTAWILDLEPHPNASLFDYDDDPIQKESSLRALAIALRAYARGDGRVTHRPSLIRRRPIPRVTVETGNGRWVLGHRTSVTPSV